MSRLQDYPEEYNIAPRRKSSPVFVLVTGIAVVVVLFLVLGSGLLWSMGSVGIVRGGGSPLPCSSNAKQLGMALLMYSQDYDDRMPVAVGWQTELYPYIKNTAVFTCPQRPYVIPGYSFNSTLSGVVLKRIASPAAQPALFESSRGLPDQGDPLQSFTTPHSGSGYVVFVDGHVSLLSAAPAASAGLKKPAGAK